VSHATLASFALVVVAAVTLTVACGSSSSDAGAPADAGVDARVEDVGPVSCTDGQAMCQGGCAPVATTDAACGAGACVTACTGGQHCVAGGGAGNAPTCQASKIEHVVLIVQENHTFDSYFGKYCQAPAGSSPTCTAGRTCCEGAPSVNGVYTEPHGATAQTLDDTTNFSKDRNHDQSCELQQINGGAMDQFVTGATGSAACLGPSCANALNWALADGAAPGDPVHDYWSFADAGALADRYFQPVAGGSASNDMYFAGAHYRFTDNARIPDVAAGTDFAGSRAINANGLCVDPIGCISALRTTYDQPTIASLLLDAGKSFAIYADGYDEALSAVPSNKCASPGAAVNCPYSNCTAHPEACFGCLYDPSDLPFLYYKRFQDTIAGATRTPTPYVKDYQQLVVDLVAGTLPAFSYVKARVWRNEHPNVSTITDGVAFVRTAINQILAAGNYKDNTLVLLTWDEGGGFYDHVAPPASPPVTVDADGSGNPVPYGTRVPFIALGPFAKKGAVSHVVMEHSSVVKFLEWNFLTDVGQLQARDAWANNLGSVLDAAATGVVVPEK
jgi:phospholipase C